MKKLIVLFICTFFIGCESNSDISRLGVTEPGQLEFFYYDSKIDHNISMIPFYCKNSSLWYVSMVSEIIDADTTNYTFKEGDEVKGGWFSIVKEDCLLNVSVDRNKLWGERYLKIKIESIDFSEAELLIKQYPDSKYVVGDENLTKELIGVWSMYAFDDDYNKYWLEESGTIVEFLPNGTIRIYDSYPDLYREYSTYKINKDNYFTRHNVLDTYDEDETVMGGIRIFSYSFFDDMFEIDLIWGVQTPLTPTKYLYKRFKK